MQETSSIDLVDLAWSCTRDAGYPLLLVHGFSHNRHVWHPITERLAPEIRPYVVDLRGHGDSEWSREGRYSPSDYARDLPRLLDRLGLEQVILVGHSLGGLASSLFAAQNSERVSGLVLLDTGPDLSLGALGRVASDASSAPQSFESAAAYAQWLASILPLAQRAELASFAEKSVVRRLDRQFELKMDPAVLSPSHDAADWEQISQEINTALGQIHCPSLLIRGGLSALLSQEQAENLVHHRLNQGRLVTLEKAGHALMLDDGPALARAINDFALGLISNQPRRRAAKSLHKQPYGPSRMVP